MTFRRERGDELQGIERHRALGSAVVAPIALTVADDAPVTHFALRARMLRHAAVGEVDGMDLHRVADKSKRHERQAFGYSLSPMQDRKSTRLNSSHPSNSY